MLIPGGPPTPCHATTVERDHVQLGVGMGMFDTTLRFDNDRDVDVEMSSVSIAGAWLINERWSARAGAGVILDGELKPDDGTIHEVEPGGLVAVGGEYRASMGDGSVPFVDLSLFLGASWTKTVAPSSNLKTSYFATDIRLGARTSWNIKDHFFPHVAVRIFGGPVNWELGGQEIVGNDKHHYQIALGAAAQIGPVGVFAEWAGLGEKAVSAGVSTAW